jgi:hypothetical protein
MVRALPVTGRGSGPSRIDVFTASSGAAWYWATSSSVSGQNGQRSNRLFAAGSCGAGAGVARTSTLVVIIIHP